MTIKVMTAFGTRPEAIKMAPVIKLLEKDVRFESIVVVTAQHREMLDQVLSIFNINPDFDLNIMKNKQSLNDITINILENISPILSKVNPDIVLVHGDTTTTFSVALSAFYKQIKVGHIEAGLRSGNKYSPFPEEMNRVMTDAISDIYFSPTMKSKNNLMKENISSKNIFVTGNTAIDAIKYTTNPSFRNDLLSELNEKKIILVTLHRRENLGEPIENVVKAINKVTEDFEGYDFVFPMHKNPLVRNIVKKHLDKNEKVHLIEPLSVEEFHNFEKNAFLILSDSGGVQEEAPYFNVPVLVLRNTTERPEGIESGTLKLIGTEEIDVYNEISKLICDPDEYDRMANSPNPFGDGLASERILDSLAYFFGVTNVKPEEFN